MNRDLSLRGILNEWVREVVGIEGRLPRTLGKLFAQPGFLTRATLDGERDAYLSALKLYIVAHVAFFFFEPALNLFPLELEEFLRDASRQAVVEQQRLQLEMSAETYEVLFNSKIRQQASTFVFLLIPAVATINKALLPARPFGEHLIYATDFLAWLLLVVPLLVIVTSSVGIGLGWVAMLLRLLTLWYAYQSLQAAFELREAVHWLKTWMVAAGVIGMMLAYPYFLYWSTLTALRLGT